MEVVWRSRGRRRSASAVDGVDLKISVQFLLGFLLMFAARISLGDTNPGDGKAGFCTSLSSFLLLLLFGLLKKWRNWGAITLSMYE